MKPVLSVASSGLNEDKAAHFSQQVKEFLVVFFLTCQPFFPRCFEGGLRGFSTTSLTDTNTKLIICLDD